MTWSVSWQHTSLLCGCVVYRSASHCNIYHSFVSLPFFFLSSFSLFCLTSLLTSVLCLGPVRFSRCTLIILLCSFLVLCCASSSCVLLSLAHLFFFPIRFHVSSEYLQYTVRPFAPATQSNWFLLYIILAYFTKGCRALNFG
jgi:hypothetical protein